MDVCPGFAEPLDESTLGPRRVAPPHLEGEPDQQLVQGRVLPHLENVAKRKKAGAGAGEAGGRLASQVTEYTLVECLRESTDDDFLQAVGCHDVLRAVEVLGLGGREIRLSDMPEMGGAMAWKPDLGERRESRNPLDRALRDDSGGRSPRVANTEHVSAGAGALSQSLRLVAPDDHVGGIDELGVVIIEWRIAYENQPALASRGCWVCHRRLVSSAGVVGATD